MSCRAWAFSDGQTVVEVSQESGSQAVVGRGIGGSQIAVDLQSALTKPLLVARSGGRGESDSG